MHMSIQLPTHLQGQPARVTKWVKTAGRQPSNSRGLCETSWSQGLPRCRGWATWLNLILLLEGFRCDLGGSIVLLSAVSCLQWRQVLPYCEARKVASGAARCLRCWLLRALSFHAKLSTAEVCVWKWIKKTHFPLTTTVFPCCFCSLFLFKETSQLWR